jgi:hypothetical protein
MADTILTALQSLALACEKEGEHEPMTIIMPDRAFTALCRKLAPMMKEDPFTFAASAESVGFHFGIALTVRRKKAKRVRSC